VRLIYFGAGYDMRCVRFLLDGAADACYEFDLPEVAAAKQTLLQHRFRRRRTGEVADVHLPTVIGADLNDADVTGRHLDRILSGNTQRWHTIFVAEGVLMYLNKPGAASTLLGLCSDAVQKNGGDVASLCFADRLEGCQSGDRSRSVRRISSEGWRLENYGVCAQQEGKC